MSVDYYDLLGINRTCSAEDVKKAYKKEALKWHPDKNLESRDEAEIRFRCIAEAYEVLGDEDKRSYYDRTGTRLKDMPDNLGDVRPGSAHFSSNPFGLFEAFFGSSNIFQVFEQMMVHDPFFSDAFHEIPMARARTQRQPFGFGHNPFFPSFMLSPFSHDARDFHGMLPGPSRFHDPFMGAGSSFGGTRSGRRRANGTGRQEMEVVDLTQDENVGASGRHGGASSSSLPGAERTSSRMHAHGHHNPGHAHRHGHGQGHSSHHQPRHFQQQYAHHQHQQQQQQQHRTHHSGAGAGDPTARPTTHASGSPRRVRIHIS